MIGRMRSGCTTANVGGGFFSSSLFVRNLRLVQMIEVFGKG